jgi:predicted RNA-binding Zn-ribbon protein involved in translation (DUF1610 family)
MPQVTNLKKLQKKSLRLEVTPTANAHIFSVKSGSDDKVSYIVYFSQGYHEATCTCKWMQNGGNVCCHVMAAVRFVARLNGNRVSFWATEADAKRQKKRKAILNGIWVTVRKREKCMKKEEKKQSEELVVYVCPGCGDEIIARPGQELYCEACWCESNRQRLVACQEAA